MRVDCVLSACGTPDQYGRHELHRACWRGGMVQVLAQILSHADTRGSPDGDQAAAQGGQVVQAAQKRGG